MATQTVDKTGRHYLDMAEYLATATDAVDDEEKRVQLVRYCKLMASLGDDERELMYALVDMGPNAMMVCYETLMGARSLPECKRIVAGLTERHRTRYDALRGTTGGQ